MKYTHLIIMLRKPRKYFPAEHKRANTPTGNVARTIAERFHSGHVTSSHIALLKQKIFP